MLEGLDVVVGGQGCLAFLAWCRAVVLEQQARCLVYRGELGEVAGVRFCRAEDQVYFFAESVGGR